MAVRFAKELLQRRRSQLSRILSEPQAFIRQRRRELTAQIDDLHRQCRLPLHPSFKSTTTSTPWSSTPKRTTAYTREPIEHSPLLPAPSCSCTYRTSRM